MDGIIVSLAINITIGTIPDIGGADTILLHVLADIIMATGTVAVGTIPIGDPFGMALVPGR